MPVRHSQPFHSQECRVNFKFLLQPYQKSSHSMKNLTFHSLLRRKMIILPILTTSLGLFRRLGEWTFRTWERKGETAQNTPQRLGQPCMPCVPGCERKWDASAPFPPPPPPLFAAENVLKCPVIEFPISVSMCKGTLELFGVFWDRADPVGNVLMRSFILRHYWCIRWFNSGNPGSHGGFSRAPLYAFNPKLAPKQFRLIMSGINLQPGVMPPENRGGNRRLREVIGHDFGSRNYRLRRRKMFFRHWVRPR